MKYLVAYDGSNVAKAALELSQQYAKVFNAEVTVVASVIGEIMTRDSDIDRAKKNLFFATKLMEEAGIPIKTELLVRGLKPGEDVTRFANENNFDAIFIGIRRRSKVNKMLFGSNASYILLNANKPVISVK